MITTKKFICQLFLEARPKLEGMIQLVIVIGLYGFWIGLGISGELDIVYSTEKVGETKPVRLVNM